MSILTLETKKYSIKIDNFEGPLDLLCYLIDKNKMNIYDVNLSDITEQYIEFLNAMEEMNLEIASEFLVMASTLLYLKSKNKLLEIFEIEHEIEEIDYNLTYKKFKEPLWRHATRTVVTRDEDGYWQLKGGEWNEIGTLLRG